MANQELTRSRLKLGVVVSSLPAILYIVNQFFTGMTGFGVAGSILVPLALFLSWAWILFGVIFPLTFLRSSRYDSIRHVVFALICMVIGLRETYLGMIGGAFFPMLFLLPNWVGSAAGSFVTAMILTLVTKWIFHLNISRRSVVQVSLLMAVFTTLQLLILPKTPSTIMVASSGTYFWLFAAGVLILLHATKREKPEPSKGGLNLAVFASALAGILIPLGIEGAWKETARELQIRPGMRIIERRPVTIDLGLLDEFTSTEGALKLLTYLAASPKWRLQRVPDWQMHGRGLSFQSHISYTPPTLGGFSGWTAELRRKKDGIYQDVQPSFMDKETTVSASMLIGALPDDDSFDFDHKHYLPIDVNSKVANIPIYEDISRMSFGPIQGQMAMEARSGGLLIRFAEKSSADYGVAAQQFLDDLRQELQLVSASSNVEEIQERFAQGGDTAAECTFGSDSTSSVHVWGVLSPDTPGFITINVDGEALSSKPEWIGWSSDSKKKFYFFEQGYRYKATSRPTTVQVFFKGSSFDDPNLAAGTVLLATCDKD